ncbi:B3 domain-containing transcription factor VRN1, partial [Mucuna pruriens]
MQPRRRRYVRASSETERESKHFLKIILPSAIHANQLWSLQRIPEEFIKRFGDELSSVATITVPDGCVWKMRLKRCGKHVLFCSKWRQFVKYYSLSYGSHLVFRYEGNSKFRVLIFDITSTEICYPCKTRGTSGTSGVEIINEDDVNLKSESKPRKKESCSSHGKLVKSGCSENRSCSEIAKEAANRFKPKNPFVTCTIRLDRLYVGSYFSAKYLKPNVDMKLQNCDGEKWDVSCTCHGPRNKAMVIAKGWSKFVRDNDLSEGDACVLELIKRDPGVLKLTVLRAPQHHNSPLHTEEDRRSNIALVQKWTCTQRRRQKWVVTCALVCSKRANATVASSYTNMLKPRTPPCDSVELSKICLDTPLPRMHLSSRNRNAVQYYANASGDPIN